LERPSTVPGAGLGTKYISFRLDGKLIGIEIIDILPSVINSLYGMWDPKYADKKLAAYMTIQVMHLAQTWFLFFTCLSHFRLNDLKGT